MVDHYIVMINALKLFSVVILLQFAHHTQAQHYRYLSLEKKGRIKSIKIYPGEFIKLRFVGESRFYERKIIDFMDPYIILPDSKIGLGEIAEIDISSKQKKPPLMAGLGSYLPVAGAGYFAVDMINRTLVNKQSLSIDKKVLQSSLIMIGAGYLFRKLGRKKFKVKPGNRLRIVDLKPGKK